MSILVQGQLSTYLILSAKENARVLTNKTKSDSFTVARECALNRPRIRITPTLLTCTNSPWIHRENSTLYWAPSPFYPYKMGLDYVIVEARRHRIRLIFSLVNNLNAFGGKAQYVKWAEEAGINVSSSSDSFFSQPIIKDYYKAIVTRKNSLNGVKYMEELAIFAWELMNEPRCNSSSSAPVLQAWLTEMAAFIKSLDPKHLVTVGLEGFYGLKKTENSGVNPGKWAASLGSDFIQNSAIDNIDFASVHAYPDSWGRFRRKIKFSWALGGCSYK